MKYRITIEVGESKDDRGYENWEDIYRQTVPAVSVSKIADVVNEVYSYVSTPEIELKERDDE